MADEHARRREARGQRKPLAGYLRLTVDRHGKKIGYDVQKDAILAGAAATGETIGEWYQDKDLTAADLTVHRPDYERMLSDVQAGQWGGIGVWRLDRLVRLTREFERVNAILEDSGGYLLSIDPMMTTRDPMGKFMLRIVVMLAEMEIVSMRARAVGHHRRKAQEGRYSGGGHRPFGFMGAVHDETSRVINSGQVGIAHNPTEAALIREAVRRLLNGESYSDIVQDWGTRVPPVLGTRGKPFRTTTLQSVLHSARIAGLREYQEEDSETGEVRTVTSPSEWRGIVTPEDWRKVRALSATRTPGRPHEYLLSGVATCGDCNSPMYGGSQKNGSGRVVTMYRCLHRSNSLNDSCGKLVMQSDPVDTMVVDAVMKRIARTPAILDAVDEDIQGSPAPEVQTSMEIIQECDGKLSEYASMAALPASKGGITRAEWMTLREGVLRERAEAVRRLESSRSTRAVPMPLGSDRQDLRRWYDALTVAQRRAFVRAHVARVTISRAPRKGRPSVDLDRVSITFADAQVSDAGSNEASVRDLHADALSLAPLV